METVGQYPFVLCAWPSFADQPYINNYRIYDDRVGETTRFTYRPDHEWYWFPQQTATEVSMLKCYDSIADSSVSRRNRDGRHEVGQHAVNAMPAGYELADFLHGLASGADARL